MNRAREAKKFKYLSSESIEYIFVSMVLNEWVNESGHLIEAFESREARTKTPGKDLWLIEWISHRWIKYVHGKKIKRNLSLICLEWLLVSQSKLFRFKWIFFICFSVSPANTCREKPTTPCLLSYNDLYGRQALEVGVEVWDDHDLSLV